MSLNLSPNTKLPWPLEGYTLIERLGRGGFGEVWKAEAPGGLLKAIKFVFGDLENDDEENRSARQEEKALKRVKNIRHPYVLSLERYDNIDGQLVIVMELADRNLWDRFRECHGLGMPGIPRDELMRYMEETAEALDLMNNHYHIQHLDVKPQNLFLVFNHVKVGDFGLAKVLEGVRGTITGGVTPVYAGPETFNGDVSRFTDQYSLTIVYQEMLTGRRPFNGSNTKQLVMQHLTGAPDLDPLPPAEREIVARGLAKEPEQRWPSCSELVRNLKLAGQGASTLSPTRKPAVMAAAGATAVTAPTMKAPSSMLMSPTSGTARAKPAARRVGTTQLPSPTATPHIINTPMPTLVTPRLITQQGASNGLPSPAATLQRPIIMPTARMSTMGLAEPERAEEGVLMPALIVGLGETGLRVLQATRAAILERFGSLDAVPHIRFLYVDTDAAATGAAMAPASPYPLTANEVLLTRLNRPAHYMQRDGLPPVDQWMPAGMLYQLPRDPQPAGGVRSYGRLALADSYRTLVQRIRQQIEAFVTDQALDSAAKTSGLGVRSNRARIYLAANIAGGTGGGMFLDMAYILRHELRQIGYVRPDCVGLLFAPAVDAPPKPLANAYAALSELGYFHQGRHRYTAKFDADDQPIMDSDGPFRRTSIFQLSKKSSVREQNRSAGLAARAIYLDLFTPVGRRCDEVRQEADQMNEARTPVVQPFGLYRLSWPRPAVLSASTRRFGQRLVQGWMKQDASHLREPVQGWLDENWGAKRLTLEEVVDRYNKTIREHLHEDPERVLAAFIEPLRGPAMARRLEPAAAADVLQRILAVVGKPEQERDIQGTLHEVLAKAFKKYSKEAETTLFNWTGWFVEQPQFRLPGAEEAVAQITERVQRTIAALEGTRQDLKDEVYEGYNRTLELLGMLGSSGRGVIGPSRVTVSGELLDTILKYAKKRVTLMVLDATLALYRAMTNVLPDCLRDVTELRKKLTELIQTAAGGMDPTSSPGPGRMILPQGVSGLDAAADLFLGALPSKDVIEFEKSLQADLAKKFGGVVGVCTKPTVRQEFLTWLATQSRQFLDARLENTDPATVFFRHKEIGDKTDKMLVQAFEEAAPDVTSVSGRPQMEATILAVPEGADGDRFRVMVAERLPIASFIPATLADDIIFLREYPLLPLAELPQLGPLAKDAYDRQLATEHSPHARTDIPWAQP